MSKIKVANIRVDEEKWKLFKQTAKKNESDASKELRKFINRYLAENAVLSPNPKGDK